MTVIRAAETDADLEAWRQIRSRRSSLTQVS
jgi:hypothetical protein